MVVLEGFFPVAVEISSKNFLQLYNFFSARLPNYVFSDSWGDLTNVDKSCSQVNPRGGGSNLDSSTCTVIPPPPQEKGLKTEDERYYCILLWALSYQGTSLLSPLNEPYPHLLSKHSFHGISGHLLSLDNRSRRPRLT